MSYINVAAASSYGRFNIKFAEMAGLETAVYWEALMSVLAKVSAKKTFDDSGYFVLDRDYMQLKTTLSYEKQLCCDLVLKNLGILDTAEDGRIRTDVSKFFAIITEEDLSVIKAISKSSKTSKADKAAAKKEAILCALKSSIKETDEELLLLYQQLVEVLYDKGVCKKAQIALYISVFDAYTNDRDVKLILAKKAIALGYRDPAWVINAYEKDHKPGTHLNTQKIATKVSEDFNF